MNMTQKVIVLFGAALLLWGSPAVAGAQSHDDVGCKVHVNASHNYEVRYDDGRLVFMNPDNDPLDALRANYGHCDIDANAFSGDNDTPTQVDDWGSYGPPPGWQRGGQPDCSGSYDPNSDTYHNDDAVPCAPLWYLSDLGVERWWEG